MFRIFVSYCIELNHINYVFCIYQCLIDSTKCKHVGANYFCNMYCVLFFIHNWVLMVTKEFGPHIFYVAMYVEGFNHRCIHNDQCDHQKKRFWATCITLPCSQKKLTMFSVHDGQKTTSPFYATSISLLCRQTMLTIFGFHVDHKIYCCITYIWCSS